MKQINIVLSSAGTGKTYYIVSNIITKLLSNDDNEYYKNILAITFTNKAVNEIKERIIHTLRDISLLKINKYPYIDTLCTDKVTTFQISRKSKIILSKILNNKEKLKIYTIDSMNMSLIRKNYKYLDIKKNVKIETNKKFIIKKILKNIYNNKNVEKKIKYYLHKNIDKKNNFYLENNLYKEIDLILNENDILEYNNNHKDININIYINRIRRLANIFFKHIKNYEPHNKRSILFLFEKLLKYNIDNIIIPTKTNVSEILEKKNIVKLFPVINRIYLNYLNLNEKIILYKEEEKKIKFQKLHKYIIKIINSIYKKDNIIFINEINKIINNHIYDKNLYIIYEDFSNIISDIYIDEFQDISKIQWDNIIPLIDNIISENKKLTIVGDLKQSIYRWRGSCPEYILNYLIIKYNNYLDIKVLNINWRSSKHIVKFNNEFFYFIKNYLSNILINKFYNNIEVKCKMNNEGYIKYTRINAKNYIEETLKTIENIIKINSKCNKEIFILVRNNTDISIISEYLISKKIKINSSIYNYILKCNEVKLIDIIINIIFKIRSNTLKLDFLNVYSKIFEIYDKEKSINELKKNTITGLINFFKLNKFDISLINKKYFSIYDLTIYLINQLSLQNKRNKIYISSILNTFLNISRTYKCTVEFLEYWNSIKNELKISTNTKEKINITTIHKSKGLEFETTIIPIINWKIKYKPIKIKINNKYHYLSINRYTESLQRESIRNEIKKEKEMTVIDEINTLYVATTRAKNKMYIIFENTTNVKNISFYINKYFKDKLNNNIFEYGIDFD